jgi:hypothetical protein
MREFTGAEKSNIMFFGNWADFGMQLDELKIFLEEVETFIAARFEQLKNGADANKHDDDLDNRTYHFEHTQGDILRKSIIISLAILLERTLDVYCDQFKTELKLNISHKDFRGDMLDRFKYYSIKILKSTFDFDSETWRDIVSLYEIRNCLVHNGGSLDRFAKRKTIENYSYLHENFEIENDWIYLSQETCMEMIELVDTFIKKINEFSFQIFPDEFAKAK